MKKEILVYNENTYQFVVKQFDELTINELYDILSIRQAVFVVEQACAFLDNDEYDKKAVHVYLRDNDNNLVAYARILDKGIIYKEATIGRVLTISAYRNKHLGRLIFTKALEQLYEYYGMQKVKIQAQSYLVDFYKTFGFTVLNDAYLDTGILHNDMLKDVS